MFKLAKQFLAFTSLPRHLGRQTTALNTCSSRMYSSTHVDDAPDLGSTKTNPTLSYSTTVSEFHLVSDRIQDLVKRNGAQLPSKMVYGFPHQQVNLTFGELSERVRNMVQSLAALGLRKGDRVAFAVPNCHELVVGFLAAAELGLIAVLLNPAYQAVEFEYMLKKTNAKALFIYDTFKVLNHMALVQKMCPELEASAPGELKSATLPDLRHVIVLNSPLSPEKKTYKGTWAYSEFSKPKSQASNVQLPYVDVEDPCLILFTSGTTGAVMTHHGLLNSAYLSTAFYGNPSGLKMICNPIPFFHIMGLATGLLIPLLMGSSIVFPFYFPDTLFTLKALHGYKCVTMRGTPTQFIDLINHPERKNYDLSNLENAIIGGSSVAPELQEKLKKILHVKTIGVGYG